MDAPIFQAHATDYISVRDVDTVAAVIATYGQLILQLSITQAREFGLALERAADEAELKLDGNGK